MADRERNAIGERGERIAAIVLTRFAGMQNPLFKPCFLGEKWPAMDLYVELLPPIPKGLRPFFFAQVKSTGQGYDEGSGNLKVKLSADDVGRLLSIPAPTYFI